MSIVAYYCGGCDTLSVECDVSSNGERQCPRCSEWVHALTKRDVTHETMDTVPPWAYEQLQMRGAE